MGEETRRVIRFSEGRYNVALYLPACPAARPQVWIPLEGPDAEDAARALPDVCLAAVGGVDWNRDLSPWPAARAFRSGEDFAGGASAFLSVLTERLLPRADREAGRPSVRGIAGYSLAGLFALWAVCQSGCFERAASMSGSLWYDGFTDWLRENLPEGRPARAYLSLGEREPRARDGRLARVGVCTEETAALLRARGVPVRMEWNEGGHFQDVAGRIARGIAAICGE